MCYKKRGDLYRLFIAQWRLYSPLNIAQEQSLFRKYGLGVKELLLLLIFSLYSRPEIGRPEELKGKTVAVDAKGGSIELATAVALKQFGLTLGKDVNAIYLGGPVAQLGVLEKRVVDAAIGVNRAFAKSSPEMVEAFLKAYIEAIKIMQEEPETAKMAIAKYTGIKDPEALKATYETFLPAFHQRVPYVLLDSVQGVLNFSPSAEAKTHRAEEFIDHSFLEKIEASSFVKKLYGGELKP